MTPQTKPQKLNAPTSAEATASADGASRALHAPHRPEASKHASQKNVPHRVHGRVAVVC